MGQPDYIKELLAQRGVIVVNRENYTTRGNDDFNEKPRERSKDLKIKRCNDSSRKTCEEPAVLETPAVPFGGHQKDRELPKAGDDNELGHRENDAIKTYSGITAYHNKNEKGTKVHINLQTPEDAREGMIVEITAELKQRDRFREIKEYEGDDDIFKDFVVEVIKTVREQEGVWAIGRAHTRSKRSNWYKNTLCVAKLENDIIVEMKLFTNYEEYAITMDMALSTNQKQYYHSGGIYGSLRKISNVPTLATAERKKLK